MFTPFFALSCTKQPKVQSSFYHWQHQLNINSSNVDLLNKLHVKSLYVRLFDIDYKNKTKEPVFLSPLKKVGSTYPSQALIPCIYITNQSFKNISPQQIKQLVQKTAAYIRKVSSANKIQLSNELQIDCDWTQSTKLNYFNYLKLLRKQLPQFNQLSVTIRLHQYKYPHKTGIPPVDKGSLMVYNMGNFENVDATNAIYSNQILKQYLSVKNKYPLHLDIAMPVFSWALVFRFGKAMKIVNQPNILELENKPEQFTPIGAHKYKATKNGYWNGLYIYKNDIIRVDKVDAQEIEKGLEMIRNHGKISPHKIIYYQLHHHLTQYYTYEEFKKFTAVFN